MHRRPDEFWVWPARRAGHTLFTNYVFPLLVAVLAAASAASALPAVSEAAEDTGPRDSAVTRSALAAAEVRITEGCVAITDANETIRVGPDCEEVTGDHEQPSGEPTGESGSTQRLQEYDSARGALDGLLEECESHPEPEKPGRTGEPPTESTTDETTAGDGRFSQAELSRQECNALLDAFASEIGRESTGEDTVAGEATTPGRTSPQQESVAEPTVPQTTTSEDAEPEESDPGQTTAAEEAEPQKEAASPDAAPADAEPADAEPANAAPAEDFVDSVGVNTHINYTDTAYGDYELVRDKLENLGVKHIRDKAHLGDEEFNKKVYGRYQDLNDSAGIKTNLIVDPREQGLSNVDAEKVDEIVELAGDSLATLEGPNELDIAGEGEWPERMRDYQRELFEAVNDSSSSDTPVLSASLAHAKKAGELGDMSDVMDAGNMHPYPGGGPPTEDLEDYNVDNTRRVSGEKPLVATETGYHTAEDGNGGQPGVSEEAEAKYLPRMFLEYFDRGIARTFSYELLDQRPDPSGSDQEENFGLVRADGTDKPAYTAMRNLLSLLDDPAEESEVGGPPGDLGYSISGDTEDVREVALYKQDGTFYLILWQEVPSYDTGSGRDIEVPAKDVTVSFDGDVGEAATYLPSESNAATGSYDAGDANQLEFTVPDHPLVVEVAPTSGSLGSAEETSAEETSATDAPPEDTSSKGQTSP